MITQHSNRLRVLCRGGKQLLKAIERLLKYVILLMIKAAFFFYPLLSAGLPRIPERGTNIWCPPEEHKILGRRNLAGLWCWGWEQPSLEGLWDQGLPKAIKRLSKTIYHSLTGWKEYHNWTWDNALGWFQFSCGFLGLLLADNDTFYCW